MDTPNDNASNEPVCEDVHLNAAYFLVKQLVLNEDNPSNLGTDGPALLVESALVELGLFREGRQS